MFFILYIFASLLFSHSFASILPITSELPVGSFTPFYSLYQINNTARYKKISAVSSGKSNTQKKFRKRVKKITHHFVVENRYLHQFPIAALKSYHKRGGFRQCKLVILHFWRSEAQSELRPTEVPVSAGLVPSGGSEGESSSCLFCPLEAACDLFLHFQSQLQAPCSSRTCASILTSSLSHSVSLFIRTL